jgi:hypothetical protein
MKALTTAQAQAYFKRSGRLMLNEHAGQMWVTDSFILVPVTDKSVIAELLAEFNLPFEPMVCNVSRTVVRRKNDVLPKIETVLPSAKALKTYTPMIRERIAGMDAGVVTPNGTLEVWSCGDLPVLFDATRAAMVGRLNPSPGTWCASDPTRPAARIVDRKVDGMLMPVRGASNEALRRAAA